MNKIILLFFSFPILLWAQEYKRDNVWMMGEAGLPNLPQSGMAFTSGSAISFPSYRSTIMYLTNAGICDTNGFLLFYTNGNFLVNRNDQQMPNSFDFNPGDENNESAPNGSAIEQAVLALPWPGQPDMFVLLHESADWFSLGGVNVERPLTLRYSKINMELDSGRGDITNEKNVILLEDTLIGGRIIACKHGNGRDWWILAHELWSNRFYEFLLTPDTLMLYQEQRTGSVIVPLVDALGAAVFSPDGDRFANLNRDSTLDIFSFDRCSGMLDSPVTVFLNDTLINMNDTLNLGLLSCAFSPSGRYLYACNTFRVFQFDMMATDIAASKTMVANYDGFTTNLNIHTTFFNMRLAIDNKIYISTYDGSEYLHVINYPDSAGNACGVTQHSFVLSAYNNFSMPNAPNYGLGAMQGSSCDSLVGISTVSKSDIIWSVYPNPSSGNIYISIDDPFLLAGARIIIYNVLGEIVFSATAEEERREINIQNIAAGSYWCRLIFRDHSSSYRMMQVVK